MESESSKTDITWLCECNDLIFSQECWLSNDELHLLRSIHIDCDDMVINGMDDTRILNGRPYGGVAI